MRFPLAAALLTVAAAGAAADPVDYARDVRPILATQCFTCHGPDEKSRKADLRLDVRDDAVKAGAIAPGKADASEFLKRLTTAEPTEKMPPAAAKKPPLTADQIDTLRRWVNEGAKYGEHWSFAKLKRPAAPDAAGVTLIDRFVRSRLAKEKLPPAAPADKSTLVRRLTLDLTGLPPTPAEVRAFVTDAAPDAYEKLVERLLASPHYGERMAVFWLDLVRYADSIGYHSDNPMNVSPYRDYVIRSFNANLRFDQFTIEQLAGDLLPQPTLWQQVATAYNRLLQTTEEGGAQAKEYEAKYAADRVRNFGQVWLGGTIMCAECHNHKFDPYTAADFYSMAAFFADVQEGAVGRREPGLPVPTPEEEKRLAALTAAAAAAQKTLSARAAVVPVAALKAERAAATAAEKARAELEASVPRALVTKAGAPRTVRVLPRGNWLDATGPVVAPNTPAFLPPMQRGDAKQRPTRLDLARWTVSADNPLTARVFVNRVWKQFFGTGISKSLEESGAQGELPTHPELLDWLAAEFQSDWDVKRLVRLIVTSETYRQSSAETPALRERDPFNRLLARQGRWRLDAEFVRDGALASAGLLNHQIGGKSVFPYQPPGYWAALNFPTREWQKDAGEKVYRRGLYTHWQRTFLHPAMVAFDAPSREECTCDRPRSNIPQQALVLLNDPVFVEAARAFAARALAEGGADDGAKLAWAFTTATSRAPKPEEAAVLRELLARQRAEYAAQPANAARLLAVGDRPAPAGVNPAELAAWTNVCRAVLNLHESITRQ
ncbi:PSD1 and planctomycete cytochrome C domain-containing protein [Urbifossiella limnaea]|uniref:Planctomycete cytochrome C n=1 Tax=Urbifossiella limnaea TaxID=2528023 RepID=A0A517XTR0_9BACT|nr:PSD1 and planctomycete cytochrome C domain-containing protein [Urbifossiella limnaea]QDU20844.1 Planctomycete cytochrome C [Urbifossiella limnaea]